MSISKNTEKQIFSVIHHALQQYAERLKEELMSRHKTWLEKVLSNLIPSSP